MCKNEPCQNGGFAISYGLIFGVGAILIAVYNSDIVWTWVNGDEEEDTVRFRQRLVFVAFNCVVLGLVQTKRCFER